MFVWLSSGTSQFIYYFDDAQFKPNLFPHSQSPYPRTDSKITQFSYIFLLNLKNSGQKLLDFVMFSLLEIILFLIVFALRQFHLRSLITLSALCFEPCRLAASNIRDMDLKDQGSFVTVKSYI